MNTDIVSKTENIRFCIQAQWDVDDVYREARKELNALLAHIRNLEEFSKSQKLTAGVAVVSLVINMVLLTLLLMGGGR